MTDLASLGLKVRSGSPDESRAELRLATTDTFVAWFQTTTRVSDGDRVVGVNMQIVERSELSDEQLAGAKAWLREQMLTVI